MLVVVVVVVVMLSSSPSSDVLNGSKSFTSNWLRYTKSTYTQSIKTTTCAIRTMVTVKSENLRRGKYDTNRSNE